MEKVDEDATLEFKWLEKKGRGVKKGSQFYGSFIYDGVEYASYDCVYMHKEGLQEPYIGKLIEIWETADKTKKVNVHWFFRPKEISVWLGDTKTLENEILFASGEGVGLANVNPLEAIAGKCNVVCVSKDSRNPQPSVDQLKAADFVFYRTFDVESCTILDQMDEKVGGIEIKYVFNKKENENQNTITCSQPTKTLPNNLKNDTQVTQDKDIPTLAAETSEKTNFEIDKKVDKEANKRKKTSIESEKLQDQPLKKMKLDDKNPPEKKQMEVEVVKDMPSKKSKVDNSIKSTVDHVNNLKSDKNSEMSKSNKADKDKDKAEKDETKMTDLPSKVGSKSKDENKLVGNVSNLKDLETSEEKENLKNEKGKISDELEGKISKKTKDEGSFKIPDNMKINTNSSNNKEDQFKRKPSVSKSPNDKYQEFVVTRNPNVEKNGWFLLEDSLKKAYDHGKAILLHNLDPDYTSEEVEDIIWSAFKEDCEAKIIPHSAISNPHCYLALVLLNKKEVAEKVLTKLDEECLMLSNGRPLVATPCPLIIPKKDCKCFGHLSIDRNKINQQAVSTSHFSQPNTIEYDMAMEWFLMQSKSKKWWEKIHKLQGDEQKKLEAKLVKK